MPFHYNPNNPADHIRSLLGDVSDTPDMTDNEIGFYQAQAGAVLTNGNMPSWYSVYRAAWLAATALMARYAGQVNYSVTTRGSLSFQNGQKFDHYKALAVQMKGLMASAPMTPYAGGISESDKDSNAADTDRVPPFFTRDQHTIPGSLSGDPYDRGQKTYPY